MTIMIGITLLILSVALWWATYKKRMSAAIIIAFWIGYNVRSLLGLLSEYDFSSILNLFSN